MQVQKGIGTKPLPMSTHIANFIILSEILSKLLNIEPDFYGKKATWPYVERPAMALRKSLNLEPKFGMLIKDIYTLYIYDP